MTLTDFPVKKWILPIIVIAQFCCTSLWFAGNAVINDLIENFDLSENSLGHLTSAVQFGFIAGTLVFAILAIADRFSPSKIFFICAILGAAFNALTMLDGNNFISLLSLKFVIGFFLAGIYPIGMKIAADYFNTGLGKSLGYLVGALVLGTAFPHFLKSAGNVFSWQETLLVISSLSLLGGFLIRFFVPDGPFRKAGKKIEIAAFFSVFKNRKFRSAAFGYFGHMWELYAFWAFVPIILMTYNDIHQNTLINIPMWSFLIIASGGIACVLGGYISQKFGAKKTAQTALFLSFGCCLVSPLFFQIQSTSAFVGFMLFWGMTVVADSPLFSTLVAQNAKVELKGTALTFVNSVGFAITIISIQLISFLKEYFSPTMLYLILAAGPLFGLFSLLRNSEIKN